MTDPFKFMDNTEKPFGYIATPAGGTPRVIQTSKPLTHDAAVAYLRSHKQLDASVTEVKSAQAERKHVADIEQLEREHDKALIELRSARRIKAEFDRYNYIYLTLTIGFNVLTGIGLLGLFLGLNTGATITTLIVGALGAICAVAAHHDWSRMHRIMYKTIHRSYPLPDKDVPDSYIDPTLDVELAEMRYTKALRKWTEAGGSSPWSQ